VAVTKASSRGVLTPAHVIATPPASHPGPGFWLWLTEDQARALSSGRLPPPVRAWTANLISEYDRLLRTARHHLARRPRGRTR